MSRPSFSNIKVAAIVVVMVGVIIGLSLGLATLLVARNHSKAEDYERDCAAAHGEVVGPIGTKYACVVDSVIIRDWYK